VLLAPLALALEGVPPAPTPAGVAGHLWLGLAGTAVAYALWFRGVEQLAVQQVSLLGLLSPVVATGVGWAVLGESMTPTQLVGAGIVLSALAIGQGATTQATRRPEPIEHDVRALSTEDETDGGCHGTHSGEPVGVVVGHGLQPG
jgi:probable blue pigment (indigoidine) exporter